MIYTVTLNPSIDYIVEVENFALNSLNRIKSEAKFPGGKGINVSRVLNRIGTSNTALGYIGGFTGAFIENSLRAEKIQMDFIHVSEDTRINIKLKTGEETEINGNGPHISKAECDMLLAKIREMNSNDTLVLAGSIPPAMPNEFYVTAAGICAEREIKLIVDTSGKSLLELLKYKPFLIKPNHHELGGFFDTEISCVEDAVEYGRKLTELGAQNVIVSMAGDGAVLCTNAVSYSANVPVGKVVNSVGSGDSLVAGFTGMYEESKDILKAFKYGIAAGSATAFSQDLGEKELIDELAVQIEIKEIKGAF
ncbi:1-phosphofructokinase [Peribacillus sp. SCS-37]|uniref:1-phosphofructokinase n=1 Tax=Paraperibacillus esterisolvens TaxID=3115296 RepID=UPI003906AE81